jgi:hypothetical protein
MKAYTTYKEKEIEITNPYNNDQKEYVIVEYREEYDPGVWTYSNGDPGYPPDFELEMCSWKLIDEDAPTWLTDELVEETFYNIINKT